MNGLDKAVSLSDVRIALRNALTPKYGEREATAMARMIVMNLKGWDFPHLMANENREASDFIKGRSGEILEKLLRDMPLQYALGETDFYGLKLKVASGVLIPRPETEELVDLIVKENRRDDLRVMDICTGSGAIAIALARNLPFSEVTALELSPEAMEIARENARKLKTRIEFVETDVFHWLPEDKFDIIVSNPPYVDESEKSRMEKNVLDYEPAIALFVPDEDPLRFYRRIIEIGKEALEEEGRLYFEINPRHADELKKLLEYNGYSDVRLIKDVHGNFRFCTAQK